jgi:hypothetical protein
MFTPCYLQYCQISKTVLSFAAVPVSAKYLYSDRGKHKEQCQLAHFFARIINCTRWDIPVTTLLYFPGGFIWAIGLQLSPECQMLSSKARGIIFQNFKTLSRTSTVNLGLPCKEPVGNSKIIDQLASWAGDVRFRVNHYTIVNNVFFSIHGLDLNQKKLRILRSIQ